MRNVNMSKRFALNHRELEKIGVYLPLTVLEALKARALEMQISPSIYAARAFQYYLAKGEDQS